MAKLSLTLLALLAALLVVADATIFRTTITTTEVEEENPFHGGGSTQQCPSHMLQGKKFTQCKDFLRQTSRPYDDILRVVDVNPIQREQELLQGCCDELQDLQIPQCSCDALKKIIREQQGGRFQGQEEMLQKAERIPSQCGIRGISCRIQGY